MSDRDPSKHTADILRRYNAGTGGGGNAGGVAAGVNRSDLGAGRPPGRESLVDVLDRVLDKGVVIAGDISISLLDIELLTIKLRLLIASVDKAREMGIDWWNHDPQLSSAAKRQQQKLDADRENRELRERIEELESRLHTLQGEHGENAPDRRPVPSSRQAVPQQPDREERREGRGQRSDRGG